MAKSDVSTPLKLLSSNENKGKWKIFIEKKKHEVMLFTLETQSSKKLSSSEVLLSIEWRLQYLSEKHFIQKTRKLSLAILKNGEITA